jgi:hypothetical protein
MIIDNVEEILNRKNIELLMLNITFDSMYDDNNIFMYCVTIRTEKFYDSQVESDICNFFEKISSEPFRFEPEFDFEKVRVQKSYNWNQETIEHFQNLCKSSGIGSYVKNDIYEFIQEDCQLEDGDNIDIMVNDLYNKLK